jgi:hypothetical protein
LPDRQIYTFTLCTELFTTLSYSEPVVCVYDVAVRPDRTHTHHRFKITLPNTDQAHDKNICGSLRVISVKHSCILPDDGSHKIRNMSE